MCAATGGMIRSAATPPTTISWWWSTTTEVLEYWAKAEDHLLREYAISHRLTAPVNFIVHSLADVNLRLKLGRYFFTDIVREGIALYEAPHRPFELPQTLEPSEALQGARGYFKEWFESASGFRDTSNYAARQGSTRRPSASITACCWC